MDEKLFQQLIEVNYLTTENAWRYRSILRFFYEQHERLRHYLFPEEVYVHLKKNPYFHKYTMEQLQQDLNQLVEWKNLIPRQDMGRVTTIEEFKRKKFRYQCTPYTVEIERMVVSLEDKGDAFGGSLEKTLFDRLLNSLMKITSKEAVKDLPLENLFSLWEEMYDNFRKLAENATDYLAHLESEKVEEIMMTEAFLVYKDSVANYLRNFMTSLQRTAFRIESLIAETQQDSIKEVAQKLAEYYLSIPRLEEKVSKEILVEKYLNQWQSISAWFMTQERQESDMAYLQKATNETIRRMTRFAQRLGEKHHNFKSRRKDYLHLANWFYRCNTIKEAHLLSSYVFGSFHTRHLYADVKKTEDIYAEVWDEPPIKVTLKPRIRNYREKTRTGAIISRKKEKEETMEVFMQEREAEQRLIDQVVNNDKIDLKNITSKDPYIRKTLLNWIGKCMGSKDMMAKTENGRTIKLVQVSCKEVTLEWNDGVIKIPDFQIEFL
ncbi:TIGR02677 family protein [Desulfitibacter alkalitolerans]|uniref:TIGR02677 family protein n=1 Tax=Desulfitibacter alkalitolerans TaxID=264641 RepID=UPI0004874712|nr:TIGR02677 family protein [Desulfitibacter alkalitolerans]